MRDGLPIQPLHPDALTRAADAGRYTESNRAVNNDKVLHTFGPNANFVEALLDSGARFLIVGGLAVKYFCPEREVDDLDVLIDPNPENAQRIVDVLDRFCPGHGVIPARLASPGTQLPLKRHLYLDVLTPRAETPDFEELWRTAIPARLSRFQVMLPCRDSLLALKRHAADTDADPVRREKHRKDVLCLEKLAV